MFISFTRLYRTANLQTRQPLQNPAEVAHFEGIVQTVAEAMSYVPVAQRPDENVWGGFELQYDIRCSLSAEILGLRQGRDKRVILFYDVWLTPEARQAAEPPVLRESLEREYGRRANRPTILADLREHMRSRIERASLNNESGDLRDQRLVTLVTENDPDGILQDARQLETTRDIDTAEADPPTSSLLPKVVQT